MSRINNSDFFLSFNNSDVVEGKFKLFALSYNVIRIISGTAGMAY
jgi:hypothetical protein